VYYIERIDSWITLMPMVAIVFV